MPLYKAVVLAIVQGLTELLPVSSSAHVIVTAELLHEDMSTPANALLLVMLHTGTMLAVIAYFWRQWRETFFSSWQAFWRFARLIFAACFLSGVVAVPLILLVEHLLSHGSHHAPIEALFHKLNWIAPALAVCGLLILYAGLREARDPSNGSNGRSPVGWLQAVVMGLVQGFAIPFRGFSRSGSTISAGLLADGGRLSAESFSFAMAVAITPLAIAREVYRLLRAAPHAGAGIHLALALAPSLLGLVCAFLAGLLALKWLSRWLQQGRWHLFGIYCLLAALAVQWLYLRGW
jgi:undecaprenyl-diphosphatase